MTAQNVSYYGLILATIIGAQALEILRFRLRDLILTSTLPDSPLHLHYVPPKPTKWHVDNGLIDQWSKRVFGTAWAWRVATAGLVTLAIIALTAATDRHISDSFSVILVVLLPVSYRQWTAINQIISDLAKLR